MSRSQIWLLGSVLGIAGATLPGPRAAAQGIQVAPINLDMPSGQMVATLTVYNHGAEATGMQVRGFAWTQDMNGDNLTPTPSLAVSPPIFEVPSGGSQLIRVVLRKPATSAEDSYRLLVDQLPSTGAPGSMKLNLRFSVPVFVEPPVAGRPDIELHVRGDGASAQLVAVNRGTRHGRLINPSLSLTGVGSFAIQDNTNFYVLAGSEQRWTLSGKTSSLRPGMTAHLVGNSAEGPLDKMISIASQ